MTVTSEINRSGPYNGNGVTTVFDYDFRIVSRAHLRVVSTSADGEEMTLELDDDYDVSDVGAANGGAVTITPAPVSGSTITIFLNVPFTQEMNLENQGAYYAETVEAAFDLAVMRDQQMAEEIHRAVKMPADYDGPDVTTSDVFDAAAQAEAAADRAEAAALSTDVMHVTNVAVHGASPDAPASDNHFIVQSLIDAGATHLYFPDGVYQTSGYWDLTDSSVHTVTLSRGATVVQTANLPIWYKRGEMETTRRYLTSSRTVGDNNVGLSSDDLAALNAEDWILIRGTLTTPGVTAGSRVACIRQVIGKGANLGFDAGLYRDYPVDSSNAPYVVKFVPGTKVDFIGGTYRHIDKSNTMCLFDFLLCFNPDLYGVRVEHSGSAAYRFAHGIGGSYNESHIFDLTDDVANGHGGYGVALCGATRGFRFNSGSVGKVRHAITTGSVFSTTGGFDGALPLPSELTNVLQGCGEPEASYYGPVYCFGTTNAALDCHEQGFGFTIIPNVHGCFDGLLIRADEAHVIGGSIVNCRRSGVRVDGPASNPAASNTIKASIKGLSIVNMTQEGSDRYGIWIEVPGATVDISDTDIKGAFKKAISVDDDTICVRIKGGAIDGGSVLSGSVGLDVNTPLATIVDVDVRNMATGVDTHGRSEGDGFVMRGVRFSGNTVDVSPASEYPELNDHALSLVKHISGRYYPTGFTSGVSTSNTLGNDSLRVSPFYVPKTITVDRIAAEITVAGSSGCTYRLGIYRSDKDGYPSSLVVDAGTIPADAVAQVALTINETLEPGTYWVGGAIQGSPASQPTVRTVTAGSPMVGATSLAAVLPSATVGYGTTAAGALPSTFPASANASGASPRVALRIA